MKSIKLLVFTLFLCSSSFAQTFKVTGFVSDNKRFDNIETKMMGQPLTIVIYDTSVSMRVADDKPSLMHKISDDEYLLDLSEPTVKETVKLTLKLNKTVGFITSVQLIFTAIENKGAYRHASWTATAKRF